MGCKKENPKTKRCNLFGDGIERPGVDVNGICICSSYRNPLYICEHYEADQSVYKINQKRKG